MKLWNTGSAGRIRWFVTPLLLCLAFAHPDTATADAGTSKRQAKKAFRRTGPQLLSDLKTFHAHLQNTPKRPRLGEKHFVNALSWAELAPLRNKKRPMDLRIAELMPLQDATRAILRIYTQEVIDNAKKDPATAKDTSEALHYSVGMFNLFAVLTPILSQEFVPTLDRTDPSYQVRIEGLQQVEMGLFGMIQGALTTLQSRRSDLRDRRLLAQTLRFRTALFAELTPAHRAQVTLWLAEVIGKETDPKIRAALSKIDRQSSP